MTTAKSPHNTSYRLPDHWILPAEGLFPIRHTSYVSRVVQCVLRSGAQTVLEVGCGDGWNCAQLVKVGLDVAGVDWSENGIAYARLLVPEARFEVCDIRGSRFRELYPDPFDAVILVEVLEHIPLADCVDLIRNIRTCMKPGGVLVLTTPSVNTPNTNPQHHQHFDEQTLRRVIAEAGELGVERIEGYGDAPFEGRHYRIARWIDNRYYRIKPLLHWLEQRYSQRCRHATPLDRHGFIVVAKAASGKPQ